MGICFSSALETQSPTTTEQLSSVAASRTASNTTSSTGSSNVSGNSQFSAASGWDEASPSGQILPLPNLRMFTFSELKTATRNFRSDTVLGEGGFGKVYKGWLDEKGTMKGGSATVIAVKKLNAESSQGFQEWQSEVNFLGRLSHPNLVKLLGYCWEDKELLLIYEFMQKGSLENHLFGRGSAVLPLPWDTRLKILIGAARGLAFLHASDRKVIYRDFKASNILLDGSYNAKISDFGLAKMGPTPSKSHVTTRVMGTNGYAAPEYIATGHLYVKSDVYGFGVVLVEMLTGLRVLDENRPDGKHNLVEWVKPLLFDKRKLKNIMDSRLDGKYPSRSAIQTAQLALSCIESEPKNRPSMREIVEILERIDSVHEKHKDVIVNSWDRASSRTLKPLKYRSPIHPRHDHSPIHPMCDHSPIHPMRDRSPVHPRHDHSPIHPMRDRSPVHPRHDHSPIHPVHDNSPIHPMRNRSPVHPRHDHSPIHPVHDNSLIHPMRDRSPIHPVHDRSPIHPMLDRSPIHPMHDRSPVHPRHDRSPVHPRHDQSPIHPRHNRSPVHPRHDHSPIHPRHDRSPVHPVQDNSLIHPMRDHSPIHPRHDHSPIHPRHHRSPIHPRHDVNQAYPLPPRT